jgi:hypothetical protein
MALMLACLGSRPAIAQLCVGNAAFQLSHIQIAANIAADRPAQRFTGELRVGFKAVFASGEYGIKTWNPTSFDGDSKTFVATLGLDRRPTRSSRFGMCYILSFTWARPGDVATPLGGRYTYSDETVAVTVSAGYLLMRKLVWDIMPTASLTVGTDNPTLKAGSGPGPSTYQDFCCGPQPIAAIRLGVGLSFVDSFTALPALSLPLTNAGDLTYGVTFAVRLGRGI